MGNVNKLQCFDMVNLRKELSDFESYCMKQGTTVGNQPERRNKLKVYEDLDKLSKEISSACQRSAFNQIEVLKAKWAGTINFQALSSYSRPDQERSYWRRDQKRCMDYIDAERQEIYALVAWQMQEMSKEVLRMWRIVWRKLSSKTWIMMIFNLILLHRWLLSLRDVPV